MAGGHRESYLALHSLRGGARHQEIWLRRASRVMMRTLSYRHPEMTFGTQIEIAEITAAFSPPPSPNLGIAARPASALEAMMDAARCVRSQTLRGTSQARQSHNTVLIHARKDSITADLGLWGIQTI